MKLKNVLVYGLIGLCSLQAKAQLSFGNEQFLFNPVMINPSVAGMHNNQVKLGYDARWLGLDGAPATGYLNYDRLFNGNTGWNVSIVSDRLGPISSVTLSNAFSFMVKTSEKTKLSFGLKHNLSQSYFNINQKTLMDPSDQLLFADQTGVPVNNFDASIAWMNPSSFFVGFSYRNLIPQPRFRYNSDKVEPILSIQGWYGQDFGEVSLEAFANFTTSQNTPLNTSIGAMAAIQHKFGAGVNFSPSNQIGIFTYLKVTEKINIFYNYNIPISAISKASKQSHGIGISFRIGKDTPMGNTFFLQPTNESTKTRLF